MRGMEKTDAGIAELKNQLVKYIVNNMNIIDIVHNLIEPYQNRLLNEVADISFSTYACDCGQPILTVITEQICDYLCQMIDDLRCLAIINNLNQSERDNAIHILRLLILNIRSCEWN